MSHPDRLVALEGRVRRLQSALLALGVLWLVSLSLAWKNQADEVERLRVHRLELVDDAGVVRLVLAQDSKDTQRRSRAAGLTVFDKTGAERGGFGTFEDGSVVLALDAPVGVGAAMRDRLGLGVDPDGASHVMLLDNQTRAVAKLHSDGAGGGGVQVFRWDMEKKEIGVKTVTYAGEVVETVPFER